MNVFKRLFGKPELEFVTMPAFIQADTWDKMRSILEKHPEMLGEEADALITRVIQGAARHGDRRAQRFLEERRALLRRCRAVGIPQAFAEIYRPNIDEAPPEMQPFLRDLEQLPMEQRVAIQEIFAQARSPQDVQAALQARPDLAAALEHAAANYGSTQDGPEASSQS
jgi:hypothetical protein